MAPDHLAAGHDDALFRLLVLMAMYQSRRDVDVMAIQRGMSKESATAMASPRRLQVLVAEARCALLRDVAHSIMRALCGGTRAHARDQ